MTTPICTTCSRIKVDVCPPVTHICDIHACPDPFHQLPNKPDKSISEGSHIDPKELDAITLPDNPNIVFASTPTQPNADTKGERTTGYVHTCNSSCKGDKHNGSSYTVTTASTTEKHNTEARGEEVCSCGHSWADHEDNGKTDWSCDICECPAFQGFDVAQPSPSLDELKRTIAHILDVNIDTAVQGYGDPVLASKWRIPMITEQVLQAITALIEAEKLSEYQRGEAAGLKYGLVKLTETVRALQDQHNEDLKALQDEHKEEV